MFELSKVFWAVAHPATLAFVALLAGSLLLAARRPVWGRRLVLATTGTALALCILPAGTWTLAVLEDRFPRPKEPARIDGVILLGGEVDEVMSRARGQPALGRGGARAIAFADLARRHPEARLVFSGGSGRLFETGTTEAEAMRPVLAMLGVDVARVLFDDRSRNTRENALFSRELTKPRAGETWLLVTSAAHMPRAIGCFRAVGWDVVPWPVDYTTAPGVTWPVQFRFEGGIAPLADALREWIGLAVYWWRGWTDAPFPAPAR